MASDRGVTQQSGVDISTPKILLEKYRTLPYVTALG
jgi:hypothetical protein